MSTESVAYLYVMVIALLGALIVPFMLPVLGANPRETTGCFVALVLGAVVTLVLAIKER